MSEVDPTQTNEEQEKKCLKGKDLILMFNIIYVRHYEIYFHMDWQNYFCSFPDESSSQSVSLMESFTFLYTQVFLSIMTNRTTSTLV